MAFHTGQTQTDVSQPGSLYTAINFTISLRLSANLAAYQFTWRAIGSILGKDRRSIHQYTLITTCVNKHCALKLRHFWLNFISKCQAEICHVSSLRVKSEHVLHQLLAVHTAFWIFSGKVPYHIFNTFTFRRCITSNKTSKSLFFIQNTIWLNVLMENTHLLSAYHNSHLHLNPLHSKNLNTQKCPIECG